MKDLVEVGKLINETLSNSSLSREQKIEKTLDLINSSTSSENQLIPKSFLEKIFSMMKKEKTVLEIRKKMGICYALYGTEFPDFNYFRAYKHLYQVTNKEKGEDVLSHREKAMWKNYYMEKIT